MLSAIVNTCKSFFHHVKETIKNFNHVIADQLGIEERTVRVHVTHILQKLDLDNRTQAALFALRQGLVALK